MKTELAQQATKGAPAVGGTILASMTLNEWVALATGIYIVIQIFYLVRKWFREEKQWERDEARR
jgi:hypothetical protein